MFIEINTRTPTILGVGVTGRMSGGRRPLEGGKVKVDGDGSTNVSKAAGNSCHPLLATWKG